MFRRITIAAVLVLVTACVPSGLTAFKPAGAGGGRLELVDGVPVVHLAGTPEEMGRQHGRLLREEIRALLKGYLGRFFDKPGLGVTARAATLAVARQMTIPPAYKREMIALADASGVGYNDILLANTVFDIKKTFQCTAVAAYGERTPGEGLLVGRNLDFPAFGIADRYSTVFVMHPQSGGSFVSVGFPGMIGVLSGMNKRGVTAAVLECYGYRMTSDSVPYAMLIRKALEETACAGDVVKTMREADRSTANNLLVCDPTPRALVIEMTPSEFAVRESSDGIVWAVNHFRSARLRQNRNDRRVPVLEAFAADTCDITSVKNLLKATALEGINLQAMIIEPQTRTLHLAVGKMPAAERPYVTFTAKQLGLDRLRP